MIRKIKDFIRDNSNTYGFEMLFDGEIISGEQSENNFEEFIVHLKNNVSVTVEDYSVDDFGKYESENIPDLEEGEIEFEKSIVLAEDRIQIYLNIKNFYSSEIEKLDNLNLQIFACMNDVDGDYYEFKF